jgi:hypothetical protein
MALGEKTSFALFAGFLLGGLPSTIVVATLIAG